MPKPEKKDSEVEKEARNQEMFFDLEIPESEKVNAILNSKWIVFRLTLSGDEEDEESKQPVLTVFAGETEKEVEEGYLTAVAKEMCSWLNKTKKVNFIFDALESPSDIAVLEEKYSSNHL